MSGIFRRAILRLSASVIFIGLFWYVVGWRGMFLIGALPVVLLLYLV